MPAIGVVDDRRDPRETLVKRIKLFLPKNQNWDVLDTAPLEQIEDYPSWIAENDISVLILDERLHEAAEKDELAVEYDGHNVIDFLRERYATLPIWVITAYEDDEQLQQRCSEVENVLPRNDFSDHADTYVARFVRFGTKFYQENKQQLERLAELSRKIAGGVATPEEITEIGGLQRNLTLPLQSLQLRSEWITKMEQTLDELEDLGKRIRQHLEDDEG